MRVEMHSRAINTFAVPRLVPLRNESYICPAIRHEFHFDAFHRPIVITPQRYPPLGKAGGCEGCRRRGENTAALFSVIIARAKYYILTIGLNRTHLSGEEEGKRGGKKLNYLSVRERAKLTKYSDARKKEG